MTVNDNAGIALYDLSNRPATFDIFTFLALASTCGARHVRFVLGGWKKKNYSVESAQRRFESIVEPAVALYGMDYSIGERAGVEYSHMIDKLLIAHREHGSINKMRFTVEPKQYVTVTLRKSRTTARDSNEAEWLSFAKRHKAIVIRDYDERPLELADRVKLYAGARMNFFVNNGPAILGILSEIPYLIMRYIGDAECVMASPEQMAKLGITPGFQYPWANEYQRLSYLPDTAENIEREWASMPQVAQRIAA